MDIQSTKIELVKHFLNVEKQEITNYIIDEKPPTVNELQAELKNAEKEIENVFFYIRKTR